MDHPPVSFTLRFDFRNPDFAGTTMADRYAAARPAPSSSFTRYAGECHPSWHGRACGCSSATYYLSLPDSATAMRGAASRPAAKNVTKSSSKSGRGAGSVPDRRAVW